MHLFYRVVFFYVDPGLILAADEEAELARDDGSWRMWPPAMGPTNTPNPNFSILARISEYQMRQADQNSP
jgi:hypothetical protein